MEARRRTGRETERLRELTGLRDEEQKAESESHIDTAY